jgi:hypothetical protein
VTFAVRIASGNLGARAVGCAMIAAHPSIFMVVVAPLGILLAQAANALVATISGLTPFVCRVINGQNMTTGM